MGNLSLAYEASCYSIGIPGRSVCNARNQHWVAENTGGDAVGAGEMFCASIAACAVNMVETIAGKESRSLDAIEVNVAAYRDFDKARGIANPEQPGAAATTHLREKQDVSLYDDVRIKFEMWGVSDDDAKFLVKTWKSR